jgi:hypothetical protein
MGPDAARRWRSVSRDGFKPPRKAARNVPCSCVRLAVASLAGAAKRPVLSVWPSHVTGFDEGAKPWRENPRRLIGHHAWAKFPANRRTPLTTSTFKGGGASAGKLGLNPRACQGDDGDGGTGGA